VTGIDLSENAIKVADLHSLESGLTIRYQCCPVEHIAEQEADQYDVVTCMEMLEHVPDPNSIIKACAKLVKPGGYVFFSTINRNPKSYLYAILGAEYVLNLLPKGTHDYAKFITPAELALSIRNNGLELLSLRGLSYNPITKLYSLNSNTSVNYLAACQRPL
jgi:2-polyprenyl-6-hydroxyphenyl methylase/3-demethylubiquinone-9 3-methyltransferase